VARAKDAERDVDARTDLSALGIVVHESCLKLSTQPGDLRPHGA